MSGFHEAATTVATRLCRSIAEAPVRFSGPPHEVPVTVSVGVAMLGPEMTSPSELVKNADQALYAAKNAGRNQVMLWERNGTRAPSPELTVC